MRELILISDLDSVLCSTVPPALDFIWKRYSIVVPLSDIRRYDLEYVVAAALRENGIIKTPAQIGQELKKKCWNNSRFYARLDARQDIWAALFCWEQAGMPLQVATRRTKRVRAATSRWLQDRGLLRVGRERAIGGFPRLVLRANKLLLAQRAAEEYQRVIVLEDALHIAEEIVADSSAEVWLVAQPWNRGPPPPGVVSMADEEIAARILELCRNRPVNTHGRSVEHSAFSRSAFHPDQ